MHIKCVKLLPASSNREKERERDGKKIAGERDRCELKKEYRKFTDNMSAIHTETCTQDSDACNEVLPGVFAAGLSTCLCPGEADVLVVQDNLQPQV